MKASRRNLNSAGGLTQPTTWLSEMKITVVTRFCQRVHSRNVAHMYFHYCICLLKVAGPKASKPNFPKPPFIKTPVYLFLTNFPFTATAI